MGLELLMENGTKMIKVKEDWNNSLEVKGLILPVFLFNESKADERGLCPKGRGGKNKRVISAFVREFRIVWKMYRSFSFSFFNQKSSLILTTNIISFKKSPARHSNAASVRHLPYFQNFLFLLQLFNLNTTQGTQKVTEPTYFVEVTKIQAIIILILFLTSIICCFSIRSYFPICLLIKCIYIDSYTKKKSFKCYYVMLTDSTNKN